MNRRNFLKALGIGAVASAFSSANLAFAVSRNPYANLLVLVELKGGNDGLNTVIPYGDPSYYQLRPKIAIPREQVLQLDEATGLNPALSPLLPLWQGRELAVVQGVGYPQPNLSHFRSIEIWDTASGASQYLADGWLARLFAAHPAPASFAADGVVAGGSDLGPLAGEGARAIALANTEQFLRQARFAGNPRTGGSGALAHILKVEQDILQAASHLNTGYPFRTEFPKNDFGNALKTAAQVVASRAGVAVVKVSLAGFDTHSNQSGTQARLLKDLADGIAALKAALTELDRWDSTLVLTYAEFGRRPKENQSNGTDHGTASAHFVAGGRVKGGLYGASPRLDRLDGNGNLPFAVDFRCLYATVIEKWWSEDSRPVLGGRFETVDLLRA